MSNWLDIESMATKSFKIINIDGMGIVTNENLNTWYPLAAEYLSKLEQAGVIEVIDDE